MWDTAECVQKPQSSSESTEHRAEQTLQLCECHCVVQHEVSEKEL